MYGAELCSHTTYTDDSLVGPARFKDVIGVDASGRPVIDWHAFDDHVDGCDHDADDSSDDDDDDGDDETAMRDSSDDGDEEERAIARAMADVKRVRAERERSVAFVAAAAAAGPVACVA